MTDEHLRISDAERERAAADLGEHFAEGRLSADEHAERLDRVWAARTRGELRPIFRDLPGRYDAATAPRPTGSRPRPGRGRTWRRGLPAPVLLVLAVLLVLTVLTHLPWVLAGVLIWVFVVSRLRRRAAHWSRSMR